jgi:hypothetical protein
LQLIVRLFTKQDAMAKFPMQIKSHEAILSGDLDCLGELSNALVLELVHESGKGDLSVFRDWDQHPRSGSCFPELHREETPLKDEGF